MKKAAVWLLAIVLLTGCSNSRSDVDRGMALRTKLLSAELCSFDSSVTADYGDKVYSFEMNCQANNTGDISFVVSKPQSIAGIAGTIAQGAGNLTFDGTALSFPLLADDQLSPVSAPWIFIRTLRGGYLTSAGADGELFRLSMDDSFREDALHLDIWMNDEDRPVRCEILYNGRKILSLDVSNFEIV